MSKFKKTKKMYNQGAFVPGTIGGGFNLGGAVGKNTQPNYGGFVGGMTRGYADGGEIDDQQIINPQDAQLSSLPDSEREAPEADQIKASALQKLGQFTPQLSEDDFTKPGEMIPKEGGMANFMRYNLAHRTPEDTMAMGMVGGGFGKAGQAVEEAGAAFSPKIQQMAEDYAKSKGLPLSHVGNADVDPKVGMKIAQAYEEMPHDPHKPEVKSAYDALKNETMDQYKAIKNSGLKVEPITPDMENPYSSSKEVFDDIHNNNHLYYFPTEQGFGTQSKIADHPMLAPTNEKINGKPLLANDVFRIVHDYFGHAKEGNGFGPKGEESAWLQHKQMYSPEAQKAMTTETRGQNSWVNFGPHGIENQARPEGTVYADQKAGILPDWAQTKEPMLSSQEDALNRLRGSDKTPVIESDPDAFNKADINEHTIEHPMISPKPNPSMGYEKSLENYSRNPDTSLSTPSALPNRSHFLTPEDKIALLREMIKNRGNR